MELSAIRADLKEIRYYYTRKAMFDEAVKIVGGNHIMEKAERYNGAVRFAPPLLYDLYVGLYIKGFTQEALSAELGYTPEYVQMLHKRLFQAIIWVIMLPFKLIAALCKAISNSVKKRRRKKEEEQQAEKPPEA